MLKNKKIIVGVCGSIAAYKTVFLVRLLVKEGAEVQVVMTPSATEFVTPLSFASLSKNPTYSTFSNKETGEWHNHIKISANADLLIIAPATANTIAKFANGLCDNLLSAVYLSSTCPVMIAPAMDLEMFNHPTVTKNIKTLKSNGNEIIPVGKGELASGLEGEGRMAEPEEIIEIIKKKLPEIAGKQSDSQSASVKSFDGKHVLITAGPTFEQIDPVRFIGNNSSGKMGFALAQAFADHGATVSLVTGPTHLEIADSNVSRIDVRSTDDMYQACKKIFPKSDIAVCAAAVADYTPSKVSSDKIKKSGAKVTLELKQTTDILASLGKMKSNGQILVGFALETSNEVANAKEKLTKKNLDLIVLNSLNDAKSGFQYDTNKVTLIDKKGNTWSYDLKQKSEVAKDILNKIIEIHGNGTH